LKRLETLLEISTRVGYVDSSALGTARLLANELDGILKTLIDQLSSQNWD
jgi:hypothetical protein